MFVCWSNSSVIEYISNMYPLLFHIFKSVQKFLLNWETALQTISHLISSFSSVIWKLVLYIKFVAQIYASDVLRQQKGLLTNLFLVSMGIAVLSSVHLHWPIKIRNARQHQKPFLSWFLKFFMSRPLGLHEVLSSGLVFFSFSLVLSLNEVLIPLHWCEFWLKLP